MENHAELDSKEKTPAELPDETEPPLPDGIGMDIDDIKRLLAATHERITLKDDPILMEVTVLNAFLGEMEKLHDRHNKALTKVMTSWMEKYISEVKRTTDSLGETLAQSSVETIRNIFDRHNAAMRQGLTNTRWCAAVVAVSALVNVAVFALK